MFRFVSFCQARAKHHSINRKSILRNRLPTAAAPPSPAHPVCKHLTLPDLDRLLRLQKVRCCIATISVGGGEDSCVCVLIGLRFPDVWCGGTGDAKCFGGTLARLGSAVTLTADCCLVPRLDLTYCNRSRMRLHWQATPLAAPPGSWPHFRSLSLPPIWLLRCHDLKGPAGSGSREG